MSGFEYLHKYIKDKNLNLKNIVDSENETNAFLESLNQKVVNNFNTNLTSDDADVVIFGSIARNEYCPKSDVDWTLLVDSMVKPEHNGIYKEVKSKFKELNIKDPGSSGIFGQITFSHDLVHYIGGSDDTNHNITRRILLLLESDKILASQKGSSAHDRVIRGIINNYITYDSGFNSNDCVNVPRFLLNDIIRFWRTMCVDFAFKQKEQDGEKWAIRNIKLRMSRKLIYLKGLLMCFECTNIGKKDIDIVMTRLIDLSKRKPLDVVVEILEKNNIAIEDINSLLESYDEFLGIIHDEEKRMRLSELNMKDVYNDDIFMESKEVATRFQESINKIFIEGGTNLSKFILKYGIF